MSKYNKKKAICLTFDDGYKNNLNILVPILQKYKIPATIYVCTKFLEGKGNAWWFELWDFVKKQESINLDNQFIKKNWVTKTFTQKVVFYSEIKTLIMKLSIKNRDLLLQKLIQSQKRKNYKHLFLNWNDVIELDKNPLITIGAHTHSHPVLKSENYENSYDEIKKSKLLLQQKLGHSIDHFAYPFGSKNEFGFREYDIVKKLKFKTALTSLCHKPNSKDMLNLPRYGLIESENLDNILVKINGISNLLKKHLMV